MKKIVLTFGGMLALFALAILPAKAATTINYGDESLNDWDSDNFNDVWDLTSCDLTLSYKIDMSGQNNGGWTPIEVGMRDTDAPNMDPNYKAGFMWHNWQNTTPNPNLANINDHLLLGDHGWMLDEKQYDVNSSGDIISPVGNYSNSYAFWFDRDGVDEWQDDMWQYKDEKTYNTGGVYNVEIKYSAVDNTTGTMMATINGETQGFNGYPPLSDLVGRSFTGDMTEKILFFGRGAGGGTVELNNISVEGCLKRTAEITSPDDGEIVSGNVSFDATLTDKDGDDSVQWAVRKGTCAAGQGTVFGNVDGFSDTYDWIDGTSFHAQADTTGWEDGEYCFVFNPSETSGDDPIRLTREFVVDNTPPEKVTGMTIWQNGEEIGCGATVEERRITVKWDASDDPNISHYEYQADADMQAPFDLPAAKVNGTERTGDIRNTDGTYHYRVRAIDKAGNIGEYSDWCSVTLNRDNDGVLGNDMCLGTLPENIDLNPNHFAWPGLTDGNMFDVGDIPGKNKGKAKGPEKEFSLENTFGCNCSQIIEWLGATYPEEYGEMEGHEKHGCSISVMEDFIELAGQEE